MKYSIAVSSGGMKGMFTLGVLHGLRKQKDSIVEIAGASSGSLNAAYFITGQTDVARGVYRHLMSSDFIEMKNMPPRMRIEYVWDLVFTPGSEYELDVEGLMNSDIEFYMPLLNVQTGQEELFTNRDKKKHFIEGLKASIAVPVWYGGVVRVGEHDYIDGGAINPFPVGLLKQTGTSLLGISTKRKPFLYAPNKNAYTFYAQKQYGATKERAQDSVAAKLANVEEAKQICKERDALLITPNVAFHQLTNNANILETAFQQGVLQGSEFALQATKD